MAAEPGWYADPQGPGRRWWDGAAWTEYTEDVDGLAFSATAAVVPAAVVPASASAPAAVVPAQYAYPAASVPAFVPPPVGVWRGPVDDRPWVRNMADAVRVVFAKYAQFDGRASRAEYWYWVLFVGICYLGAIALMFIPLVGLVFAVVLMLGALAIIVPNYAVAVRRLRDAGFHWAWIFLVLAPFGGIAIIVMCAQPTKYP